MTAEDTTNTDLMPFHVAVGVMIDIDDYLLWHEYDVSTIPGSPPHYVYEREDRYQIVRAIGNTAKYEISPSGVKLVLPQGLDMYYIWQAAVEIGVGTSSMSSLLRKGVNFLVEAMSHIKNDPTHRSEKDCERDVLAADHIARATTKFVPQENVSFPHGPGACPHFVGQEIADLETALRAAGPVATDINAGTPLPPPGSNQQDPIQARQDARTPPDPALDPNW